MIKKILFLSLILISPLLVNACGDSSRDSAEELGQDIKRDMQQGADKVERAVEDATD